jgi:hypothetical protein
LSQKPSQKFNRSRSRSRTPPRSKNRSGPINHDICYYHRRFGKSATRCTIPCAFKPALNENPKN